MSALDKALRQIEQQRQMRDGAASTQGLSPDVHFPVEPLSARPSRWMPVALGLLSLALVGSWLFMAGWWPVSMTSLSGGHFMNKPDARSANLSQSVPSVMPPVWPLSVASTPEASPVATPVSSEPLPVSAVAAPGAQAASAALPAPVGTAGRAVVSATANAATAQAAQGGSADTGQKFAYPAWHKAADRMWNWGLWDEAARLWLKGLKAEDPNAQMVLIGDQLTQLQATRQYAAWSPLLPVVALPKSGGNKKRWLLLAVPAATDLARARQLLMLAQGQAGTVDSWAHWQRSLASSEVLGMDGSVAPTAQSPAMAMVANRGAVAGATGVTGVTGVAGVAGVAGAQGRAAVPGALASAAGSAGYAGASAPGAQAPSRARVPSAADAQAESADGAGARDSREPPQLSRTDAERLPVAGPVAPTAKAIDVDYQMIEKSLARADHQAALDAAIKLEKYIGENWRTQYLAGVALMGLNRWEQAIAALGKAQELNPRHATAALYLSVALQERGEHARAIQVLDKAQQLQPLSPELWLNQGHSHQALGHKAEARKAYNRFLELSVNRQDLAVQRVWVQNRLQKDNG